MSSNTNWKNNSVIDSKKLLNYNQYKILYLINIIHRKRVLNHIKKFMIWMI